MSEILLMRHAETDMAGMFCGHSDPELNAQGRIQVRELIDRLSGEEFAAVYTSDLRRAHETGLAVATAFGVGCHVRPALREIGFGRWEGLRWNEIEEQDPIYSRRWLAEYPRLPAHDGESFDCFEQRVLEEIGLLATESERTGRGVAVITHAGVLRCVLRRLQGSSDEDAWRQTKPYCCVVRQLVPFEGLARIEKRTDLDLSARVAQDF